MRFVSKKSSKSICLFLNHAENSTRPGSTMAGGLLVEPGKLTGWFGRLPDRRKVSARRIVIIISQVNGENWPGFAAWVCAFLKKMICKRNMLVVGAIRYTCNRNLNHINISKKSNTIVNTHKQCNKQGCKRGYLFQLLFHSYKLTRNREQKQKLGWIFQLLCFKIIVASKWWFYFYAHYHYFTYRFYHAEARQYFNLYMRLLIYETGV